MFRKACLVFALLGDRGGCQDVGYVVPTMNGPDFKNILASNNSSFCRKSSSATFITTTTSELYQDREGQPEQG